MEDHIVAISKDPIDSQYVDLSKLKQKIFVCQAAWESILPVLEENQIKDHGRFKIVGAQTVRAIAEEGIGIGSVPRVSRDTDIYGDADAYPILKSN